MTAPLSSSSSVPLADLAPAVFRPVACAADQIVAVGEEGTRTGRALVRDVMAVVARLPPASPGSQVLVVCGDRYRVAVAALAAWQAGHAVALPPNAAPETVRALRRGAGVVALLHDTDFEDPHDLRPWLAEAASEDMSDGPGPEALAAIAGDRVIATVYTSGSTGAHQACPKTAGQLLGEAAALVGCFGVAAGQRVIATVPPHHLYGLLFSVLVPLAAAASFVRDTPLHAETVAAVARRWSADILVSVPVHLRSLTVLAAGELPPLVRVFSSGAPLPGDTAESLGAQLGLWVTEIFGASETGGIAWRRHSPDHTGGAWQPLPGVTVTADEEGGMQLVSPFVPPEAPRPFMCADQIEATGDGRFHLLGRRDGVLKIGGKRVALAEVEARLLAQPGVADAAVAASEVGEPRGHEIVAAVVVKEAGRDPAEVVSRLRHGLLQWFDPVVVPRRIRVVPALPREASGKLTRARLLALFDRVAAPRTDFVIREHTQTGARHRFAVQVPVDLAFFKGHFAGYPVLPGVAQTTLAIARVRAIHPELGEPRKVTKLKFRRTIGPGDEVELRLHVDGARRQVGFEIARGAELCTSGLLDYAGEFAPRSAEVGDGGERTGK